VRIVVVVAQATLAVRRYIEETGLPFDILIDETRDVARSFGVWHAWGLDAYNIARPALFLIDRSSAIRYSFVASRQTEFPSHEEIMGAIAGMRSADC
jgi:peroxiredoxin